MKKMKKLSLAMLAVLLAAGLAGCGEAASNLQTTTTTTTTAATEPPAAPEELNDFDESTNIEHELSGLKFNVPATWTSKKGDETTIQLQTNDFHSITVTTTNGKGDIDRYVDGMVDAFKSETDNYHEIGREYVTVNGVSCVRLDFSCMINDTRVDYRLYAMPYEMGYATISLGTPAFSVKSCLDDFENVVSTVRYEPPAPVGIGETVDIIDGGIKLGTLTINSVSLTSDRNRFSDDDPAQVIIINYTYENTDSSEDLFYFSSNFQVIDAGGNVCDTYPADAGKSPKKTPKGAKCTAGEAFGLAEESEEVTIYFRTNMYDDLPAITFKVPVTAE